MGGFGSGRRRGDRLTTCESVDSIDVREWHHSGFLAPGRSFKWTWMVGDESSGEVTVLAETDAVVLEYQVWSPSQAEWKPVQQRVPVEWTTCRFGGTRPWFRCPLCVEERACSSRALKLYVVGAVVACRRCCGFSYDSQYVVPRYRKLRQARRIRARLGDDGNLFEPFPPRPKWMRWYTYMKLFNRYEDATGISNEVMAAQTQRMSRSLSAGTRGQAA